MEGTRLGEAAEFMALITNIMAEMAVVTGNVSFTSWGQEERGLFLAFMIALAVHCDGKKLRSITACSPLNPTLRLLRIDCLLPLLALLI